MFKIILIAIVLSLFIGIGAYFQYGIIPALFIFFLGGLGTSMGIFTGICLFPNSMR